MTSLDLKKTFDKLHNKYPKKRAAITGAASGLGEALALELAQQGWVLWLNDQNNESLDNVSKKCKELGAKVYSANFDVSHRKAYPIHVDKFLEQEKGVDLVFTCAGIGLAGTFLSCSDEQLEEVINVNLMGTIWTAKAFLPSMKSERNGHFVTIASAAAYHAMPNISGYAASKAGVVQLSETILNELKPFNVDVTTKMTTFYTSSIAEHTRGTESEREKARSLVQMAPWSAKQVAQSLLIQIQKKQFYMVAPSQARFLWRTKRLFPAIYLHMIPTIFSKLETKLLAKSLERNQK